MTDSVINSLRYQIKNCNDLEETLHVLTGILSQSVIETVASESADLFSENINLKNAYPVNEMTKILKKRWEHNLKMVFMHHHYLFLQLLLL